MFHRGGSACKEIGRANSYLVQEHGEPHEIRVKAARRILGSWPAVRRLWADAGRTSSDRCAASYAVWPYDGQRHAEHAGCDDKDAGADDKDERRVRSSRASEVNAGTPVDHAGSYGNDDEDGRTGHRDDAWGRDDGQPFGHTDTQRDAKLHGNDGAADGHDANDDGPDDAASEDDGPGPLTGTRRISILSQKRRHGADGVCAV